MATADSGSGPGSLFGVGNKLQGKLNSFREVIEGKKFEVRRVGREMRSLIEKKENEIIRELDDMWKEVNLRMERKKADIQERIGKFERGAKELENFYKELNPNATPLIDIPKRIESVKRELDIDIPNVKLTLSIDELKDCINRMCHCEQQILAFNQDTRFQLKWSKCEAGIGDTQHYVPWGIATHPMNAKIFVADCSDHRIQTLSNEGEWIRSVKDEEMVYPRNILFQNNSIYAQCSQTILKLNESTEKKEKSKSYGFVLEGICTDKTHIYVGKHSGMIIIVLNLDLIEENRINLRTQFYKQDKTKIQDISLAQEEFYILLSDTEYPIQAFSREGILTRCVVKKDCIDSAYCFCLDQQYNILVADYGDSKVKIFSNEGKLLTQFGEKGKEKGQFTDLRGISVDELGSIVTVDWKNSHKLQAFSPL